MAVRAFLAALAEEDLWNLVELVRWRVVGELLVGITEAGGVRVQRMIRPAFGL